MVLEKALIANIDKKAALTPVREIMVLDGFLITYNPHAKRWILQKTDDDIDTGLYSSLLMQSGRAKRIDSGDNFPVPFCGCAQISNIPTMFCWENRPFFVPPKMFNDFFDSEKNIDRGILEYVAVSGPRSYACTNGHVGIFSEKFDRMEKNLCLVDEFVTECFEDGQCVYRQNGETNRYTICKHGDLYSVQEVPNDLYPDMHKIVPMKQNNTILFYKDFLREYAENKKMIDLHKNKMVQIYSGGECRGLFCYKGVEYPCSVGVMRGQDETVAYNAELLCTMIKNDFTEGYAPSAEGAFVSSRFIWGEKYTALLMPLRIKKVNDRGTENEKKTL